MVKLSPRIKFILITIDELLLVPVLIFGAYYFVPDLVPFTVVATIVGAIIFVAVKYHLVYDSLKEGSHYLYDLQGTKCTVVEKVTSTSGKVRVGAEIWEARSDTDELLKGTEAIIVSRVSLKVHVKPAYSDNN